MLRYWVEQRGMRDALGYSFTTLREARKAFDGLNGRVVLIRMSKPPAVVMDKGMPRVGEFTHVRELRPPGWVEPKCADCGCLMSEHGKAQGHPFCRAHGLHRTRGMNADLTRPWASLSKAEIAEEWGWPTYEEAVRHGAPRK
jgi:hypothetical protein